jgi:hypothetical protein
MPSTLEIQVVFADGEVIAVPNPLFVRPRDAHEVLWRCLQGRVRVRFAGDCPFTEREFMAPRGGGIATGVVPLTAIRKDPYRYVVEIETSAGPVRSREMEIYVDP